MLGKNYRYKGLDLSDCFGFTKKTALQDNTKNAAIRGSNFSLANSFGSVNGPRIAESRVFDFSGRIHSVDSAFRERRRAELSSVLSIESNFSANKYYDLEWDTKYGESRVSKAMVFEQLTATNGIDSPVIDFSFQLVSTDPRVYDPNLISVEGDLGQLGGTTLAFTIPTSFGFGGSGGVGGIPVVNGGNWDAPCKITVDGFVVNPKILIFNGTKLEYFLFIDKSTTSLVVDNTNTVSENSDERFTITDNGANIKGFRQLGGGGPLFIPGTKSVDLTPATSNVVVLVDNYADARDYATVKIEYRNTFSY